MGGKLVKSRLSPLQYFTMCELVKGILRDKVKCRIPRSYKKDSYGDIDLIVENNPVVFDVIIMMFQQSKAVKRVQVHEKTKQLVIEFFAFENVELQLDVIPINNFAFASWYDYGNMAGLIGRIIPYSLKLSHDSLSFRETERVASYEITRNFELALLKLGFNVETFRNGFETEYDMLQWLGDCYYFKAENLKHNPRNREKQKRDEKRGLDAQIDVLSAFPSKHSMNVANRFECEYNAAIRKKRAIKRDEFNRKRLKKWARKMYLARSDVEYLLKFSKYLRALETQSNCGLKETLLQYINRNNKGINLTPLENAYLAIETTYKPSEFEKRVLLYLKLHDKAVYLWACWLVHLKDFELANKVVPKRLMADVMDLYFSLTKGVSGNRESPNRILTVIKEITQ